MSSRFFDQIRICAFLQSVLLQTLLLAFCSIWSLLEEARVYFIKLLWTSVICGAVNCEKKLVSDRIVIFKNYLKVHKTNRMVHCYFCFFCVNIYSTYSA